MTVPVTFHEGAVASRLAALPMAHVSIEVGHLYAEDLAAGRERVLAMARGVVPWVEAAKRTWTNRLDPRQTLRASTCFLIDDYFTRFSSPDVLVPMIADAYVEAGLPIDYIARESACFHTGDVPLAEVMLGQVVQDPPPGSDGSNRPDVHTSGWLPNGRRSPQPDARSALGELIPWEAPSQNGITRHSDFIDVQLWEDTPERRVWTCPYLAAVWQLLRLGALRFKGAAVTEPVPWSRDLAATWDEYPAVVQLQPRAAAFTAYQTFSVLDHRFLSVEHAVRSILSQVVVDPAVADQVLARATGEHLVLPELFIDRIGYAFA